MLKQLPGAGAVDSGGLEGLFTSLALLVLPLVILYVLVKILPPWESAKAG